MIRLWQADGVSSTKSTRWNGEIEHIQSGRAWPVSRLGDLPTLLHQLVRENSTQMPKRGAIKNQNALTKQVGDHSK